MRSDLLYLITTAKKALNLVAVSQRKVRHKATYKLVASIQLFQQIFEFTSKVVNPCTFSLHFV